MPDHTSIHMTETSAPISDDHDSHHHHRGVFHRNHDPNRPDPNTDVNPVVTHGDAYVHTKRDHEQRALAMAVVLLLVGFLALIGGLGLSSWAYADNPRNWDNTDNVARTVVSAVNSFLYIIIVIASALVGGIIITWFSLWISARKPKFQRTLLKLVALCFIAIAVCYFVLFCLGIALFVLYLVDDQDYYIGFWGSLLGFIYAMFFVLLALAGLRVCRVRMGGASQSNH
eukprot:CAMPEP_0117441768 /NCGR_PEP_ID=MMETSP0759-20121206/3803_1 /TAXON_ID=63605 /ORGANISM="Percolomonas cosmopolitus, Strain WS" /LENGTH=227 /DNA_ID=CAMNT_0005233629 /DNA_START=139 /DNA_END=822 /DNA_ORIENTATION=-